MAAEPVDLVLNGFLKAVKYQERDDQRGQTDTDAYDGDLVNGG